MAPDPARFAALLCDYCLDVQPGQQVVVRGGAGAAPLMLALQREILRRDAWPILRVALEGQDERFTVRTDPRKAPELGSTVYVRPRPDQHHAFHAVTGLRL